MIILGTNKEPIKAKEKIPLSLWQDKANQLFYMQDDSPLNHIGTLGSLDPLLPKALAKDALDNDDFSELKTVHEIGPGNFNFARHFVDTVSLQSPCPSYVGHDFSDASYSFVKEILEKYSGKIKFEKNSIRSFPDKVSDDPLQAILVEVLDDVRTEFFTKHNGLEYILCVQPEMRPDAHFPSRRKHASTLAENGDFSLAVQRMSQSSGMVKEYSAGEIIEMIEDTNRWGELDDIHPAFLRLLEYKKHEFIPCSLDNLIRFHWRDVPDEFADYAKEMLKVFSEQLSDAEDAQVLHLPIAGLNFLWRLRERKKARMDFFDYGYESADRKVVPFAVFNGQVTAPVNFQIMKYAAQWLGFDARLETNREFINRTLGEDTIPVTYITETAFRDAPLPKKELTKLLFVSLYKSIVNLNPGVIPTIDSFKSYRIRRTEYDGFIETAKGLGLVKQDFQMSEGSFHLTVRK